MNGISIIIPTFNSQMFIAEAIQSVLDQEYDGELDIILSDDGSLDNTLEIAESFGDKITILTKGKDCCSQGVSGARNRGLKAAKHSFICFLDSDDYYLPGHLKKMASVLTNNPDLGFSFCRILMVKEENGKRLFKQWTHQHIFKSDILNPNVFRPYVAHTNSFIFRREIFDKVGYFNESYTNAEDSDLWMRISEQFKGAFSNHFGAVYRVAHSKNQLTNNSTEKIRNCHLNVYSNAIERYYRLGLDDPNRIFELKHMLLYNKYSTLKLLYIVKYVNLILRYPIPFINRALPFYYRIIQRRRNNKWCAFTDIVIK